MIRSLDQILTATEFGGKAAGLSEMLSFGMKVPRGFALSKRLHLDYLKEGSREGLANGIKDWIAKLEGDKVIVRSSAIGEDGEDHSYAGQLDSIVVEKTEEGIVDGILQCWEGLKNERLLAYSELTGRELKEMGVLVQEFIEADYAGVLFTRSPSGNAGMYAEFVAGRGEALVAGEVTPEVLREDLLDSYPFPATELYEKSIYLKEKFQKDLDIEWVTFQNELYFVQARPITTKVKKRVFWSNTNLNENYPDPISPLLYSIARDSYYHYFKNLAGLLQLSEKAVRELEYDFSNAVGIWGNRIYYNMSSIHNILSASPLKSYFIDAFNHFIGYKNDDLAEEDRSKRSSLLKLIWRLLRLNVKLEKSVREIEQLVNTFSEDVASKKRADHDLFYAFLDLRFHQWYRASLADFFAMIHYKGLGVFSRRFYGENSVGIQNKLLQAIPDLISTAPLNEVYDISLAIKKDPKARKLFETKDPLEIWKTIEKEEDYLSLLQIIEEYLAKWGFRCSGELMFTKENYIERPDKFIDLLRSYLQQDAIDPRVVLQAKAMDKRKASRAFVKKIFKKRHILIPMSLLEVGIFKLLTRLCTHAIASRERVRYKQAEMYFRFKQVVSRIGLTSGLGKQIFFLSYKEVGELLSSSNINRVDMKARAAKYEEASSQSFPENFSTLFGDRPDGVVPEISAKSSDGLLTGLAASAGRIRGRVKVLESVLESDKLVKGDILVTRQTDPGWAMVFPLIGGLIVERGGALSHGAIVAREFGIPAVVGVENVCSILKDGEMVILDGDHGKIDINVD